MHQDDHTDVIYPALYEKEMPVHIPWRRIGEVILWLTAFIVLVLLAAIEIRVIAAIY